MLLLIPVIVQAVSGLAAASTQAAPLVGGFEGGRGEPYSQGTYEGRIVLLRGVWSDIQSDSHDYTESFSDDGGATWRPAFVAHLTRQKP